MCGGQRDRAAAVHLPDAQRPLHGRPALPAHGAPVRRLSGRRTCKKCGHVWHIEFDPPKVANICDRCGGQLYLRDDDLPQTVRHRLEVYAQQTAPLISFYTGRSQLRQIDAYGPVEDVTERAIAALASFAEARTGADRGRSDRL